MTRFRAKDYSPTDASADADIPETLDGDLPPDFSDDTAPVVSVRRIALEPLSARVPDELGGARLDKVLAQLFPAYSRSRLQSWIEAGRVLVDGMPGKIRQPVPLDAMLVVMPDLLPEQLAFTAEPVPLDIVYEDEALVVLNKPAGLVVHPAAGNWGGTILNGLLHRYGDAAAGLPRAGIVHRLDKDTSGLMVVARTLAAQTELVRQLQARTVKRRYLALAWGTPPRDGTIDAPLGRDPRDRVRMAVVRGTSGKPARTHFHTVDTSIWADQPVSAVQCELETGRTHQIRVHLAHLGHPLLGDPLYGKARGRRSPTALPDGFARQALHAWRLGLIHPSTGRPIAWRVQVPADMAALAIELDLAAALDVDAGTPDDLDEESQE
jgi:23S rRNA pseudouridine1911/1915/1917 synthase